MKNLNAAGDRQSSNNLTAQVFLAYAAEDWLCAGTPEQPGAQVVGSPVAATIQALRQLLSEAQIAYWECPHSCSAAIDPESMMSRVTEASDNYLLVLTPGSLADALCLQGLLFALSMNKRILPVLAETVPTDRLPEPLQTLEAIDLRTSAPSLGDTDGGRQLLQTLHHEADYHHTHTQLLVKALRWERQLRDSSLLLRGKELAVYQHWLVGANQRSRYQPLKLQTLYILESTRQWRDRSDAVSQGVDWLKRWLV
ncbi:TIR domain-containing protein [Nodosilinea sp. E11]|uniref:TIR domain-containing protein n=1 Tax=Nodosilinea sp. E11 TaxID=3037479 RepID=UPI0029348050|nr:TIR domain-containing protein [Nodosilinea sp. E11]WOD41714.1 TIR domain-containing protein [Nodosilinea sp. E11]